ncbi:MAG: helix-turn-helix domain-containing protein [Puniceicoccales bacterium]|nr:helix-turn-helix domain-containing protein [Puniceicoccales bacterium]
MDGKTYTQVSKELRISPQSVRNWHTRKKFHPKNVYISMKLLVL